MTDTAAKTLSVVRGFRFEPGHPPRLTVVDQRALPHTLKEIPIDGVERAVDAIRALQVRGAPAIAIVAAYALQLEIESSPETDTRKLAELAGRYVERLNSSRPTAVNLGNAMQQFRLLIARFQSEDRPIAWLRESIAALAGELAEADEEICQTLGRLGSELIPRGARILTHCNTGALATAGIGTALAALFTAGMQGKGIRVYATETRPLLQGARLTTWELQRAGIDTALITDSMAAHVLSSGRIDLVMVGADRIVANGDTANKIGTLGIALAAHHYGVPFYVVAPSTTLDFALASGDAIPIEERTADEVRGFGGQAVSPLDVPVYNPAFDVTPGDLITAIVTEKGIHRGPYDFSPRGT